MSLLPDRLPNPTAMDLDQAHSAVVRGREGERKPSRTPRNGLRPGGTVILTEDAVGVTRAVAAELRVIGHPVVRVRHGLGDAEVEGVNLESIASVAALADRMRQVGPVSAVIHGQALGRRGGSLGSVDSIAAVWSEDLIESARLGGAALILISDGERNSEEFSRLVSSATVALPGVRVQVLALNPASEPEVQAALVARAVLGDEPPPTLVRGVAAKSPVFLLGTADRSSWIRLARALIGWLEDESEVDLADLAASLHRGQPAFPFRVGLIARSREELASRLEMAASMLSDPRQSPSDVTIALSCEEHSPEGRLVRRFSIGSAVKPEELLGPGEGKILDFSARSEKIPLTRFPGTEAAILSLIAAIDGLVELRGLLVALIAGGITSRAAVSS